MYNMNKRWGAIAGMLAIAGNILSMSIGSGFATGQESLQFFAAFGVKGCLGAALIMTITYAWINMIIVEDGNRLQLQDNYEIWDFYAGKFFGKVFRWFSIFIVYACYVVMISGLTATLNQYFKIPKNIGLIVCVAVLIISGLIGTSRITKLLGGIGVVIIAFALLVGVAGFLFNMDKLEVADTVLATMDVDKSCNSWALSGLLYTTFMMMSLVPFDAGLGKQVKSKKQAVTSGAVAGALFGLAMVIMSLAILCILPELNGEEVPTLVIAESLGGIFGFLFAIVLILGIYSTALALLNLIANFVCKDDEKSTRYRVGVILATLVAAALGFSNGFGELVNIVYPASGYVGIIALVFIIISHYTKKRKKTEDDGAVSNS